MKFDKYARNDLLNPKVKQAITLALRAAASSELFGKMLTQQDWEKWQSWDNDMFFQTIAMVMGWRIGDISPGGAFDLDAAATSFFKDVSTMPTASEMRALQQVCDNFCKLFKLEGLTACLKRPAAKSMTPTEKERHKKIPKQIFTTLEKGAVGQVWYGCVKEAVKATKINTGGASSALVRIGD